MSSDNKKIGILIESDFYEKEIFYYFLEEYQIAPSSCLFIDDSPKNIEAAQILGMKGIVFEDAKSCCDQVFTFIR